jgi:hypothetical protein
MTLIFTEGFDHQSTKNDLLGPFSIVSGVARFVPGQYGGQAVSLQQTSSYGVGYPVLERYVPTGTGGTLGFAFMITPPAAPSTFPPGNIYIGFGDNSSAYQFVVTLNYTGFVSLSVGAARSLTAMYSIGVWNFCEIQGILNTTTGAVTVKINGVNAISLAGIRTSTGLNTLTNVSWAYVSTYGGTGLIDDVYFCDLNGVAPYDNFLGRCHITTVFPTGPGSNTSFTPNNPNNANWQSVDETNLDGDVTYNTASNVSSIDTFVATPPSGLTSQSIILAVEPKVAVRKDDTLDRQMQTYLISSSVVQGGPAYDLSQNYVFMTDIATVDPATGVAWTLGGLTSLQFGYNILV